MRKYIWKNIVFLLYIVIFLSGIVCSKNMVKAETEKKQADSQFEIEAETAIGNCVKTGRNSQMKVTITNYGGDFNGLIQVITVVNNKNIANQRSFSLGSGETKKIEIPFRMQSGYKNIVVCVTDENEKILKSKKVKVTLSGSYDYFNGVLTENRQGLAYLETYTKVTWLDKDLMPDTLEEIDALDRIYINDFQTAKFSKEQYEVLKTWVKEGGDLIIGTGINANATLGIFQDDFLKGKIGRQIENNRVELSFEGEKIFEDKEGNYKIHRVSVGKGSIWIYDVDLAVPLNKSKWKETGQRYIDYQLTQQFGSPEFPNTGNENALYVDEELNIKDASRFPNIFLYSIIFGIYIVFVSLFLYFFLKRRDKAEKTWIAVPAFSAVFVLVVYILGSNTRISGPFIMYRGEIQFTDEDDITPYEKNILQLSSANNNNYTLAVPKGRMIYSEGENADYDQESSINFDSYKLGFYQDENNQFVSVNNVSAFEKNFLLSEQNRKMGNGYKSKITSNQFQCQGTFTNHTGYTLKYALLVTEYACYKLGTIKNGETIEINKNTPKLTLDGYEDEQFRIKLKKMLFETENSKDLTVEAMRYFMVIQNFIDSYPFAYMDGKQLGEIRACVDLEEDREKMENEWGVNCDGITACKMPVKIDYRYKGDAFVSNIITESKDIYNLIDKSDWSFDYAKTESVELEYCLKQGDTLTGIYYLGEVNPSIYNKKENYFSGEVLFYNYKTQKYEVVFESGKEKSIRKVNDYVNKENILKIRIKTNKKAREDSEWEVLPIISLSKKEK